MPALVSCFAFSKKVALAISSDLPDVSLLQCWGTQTDLEPMETSGDGARPACPTALLCPSVHPPIPHLHHLPPELQELINPVF